MESLSFVAGLFPLIVIGLIVFAIVALVRRGRRPETEPGIGTTRRVFLYGIAFIALMLASTGVSLATAGVLETITETDVFRRDSGNTAFGLALAIVGFPVWLLVRLAAQRSLVRYPGEAGTVARKLYAYGVLGVTAAVAASGLVRGIIEVLDASWPEPAHVATVVTWGVVWAFHWRMEILEGQPTSAARSLRRVYAYLTSTYGLYMLAIGGAFALGLTLNAAYDSIFDERITGRGIDDLWSSGLRTAVAVAIVGALWWWWHWHRVSRSDQNADSRLVTLYIAGVFGGLAGSVTGASVALFAVLDWVIDKPRLTTAAAHFDVIPAAIALVVAAGGVWGYHRAVALGEAEQRPHALDAARRGYRYLAAGVGLGTVGIGLVLLVGVGIGLIAGSSGSRFAGGAWWDTPLVTALTLLIVGSPLWLVHWTRQLAIVGTGAQGQIEREALPRRAYLFLAVGITLLSALGATSFVLFQLLDALFDRDLSGGTIDGAKWAIGVAVTAGLLGAYHWQVLKEDRAAGEEIEPEAAPLVPAAGPPKQVTAAAPSSASTLIDAIASRLGTRVTVWERLDRSSAPDLTGRELDLIVARIQAAPGEQVLLVIDAEGVQVIPH
jgi:hypothetical protein